MSAAEEGKLVETVERYQTAVEAMDDEYAAQIAEELTETDCEVCTQVGHHLGGLAIALSTSPGEAHDSAVRRATLSSVEQLLSAFK